MHGLQASATPVTGPDRWDVDGARFFPENCVQASTWDPNCAAWSGGEPPEKSPSTNECNYYDVQKFVIESAFELDAQQNRTVDFKGRARRQLEASTSKAMEFELWTGTLVADNPALDQGAVILGGGAAFTLVGGISLLGQALSNCAHGGRGTFHAPTFIVDQLLAHHDGLFKVDNQRIVTANRGDVVVSGTGYPGTGPAGAAVTPGLSWVYATGPVQYRLTDIDVYPDTIGEAMNRGRNDIEYRAERSALINFDPCCHFGILIDPTL